MFDEKKQKKAPTKSIYIYIYIYLQILSENHKEYYKTEASP